MWHGPRRKFYVIPSLGTPDLKIENTILVGARHLAVTSAWVTTQHPAMTCISYDSAASQHSVQTAALHLPASVTMLQSAIQFHSSTQWWQPGTCNPGLTLLVLNHHSVMRIVYDELVFRILQWWRPYGKILDFSMSSRMFFSSYQMLQEGDTAGTGCLWGGAPCFSVSRHPDRQPH